MTRPWLPPEDRDRSPFTGWTRVHWEATADHVLAAVLARTSPAGALVGATGSGQALIGLEGFARAALLAAYRAAGTDDADVRQRWLGWLERGLAAGTQRRGPESWPRPADNHQAVVEAAWLALALHETRTMLWDGLGHGLQQRIVEWLGAVAGKAVPPNNWLLYPVVVDAFLSIIGAGGDAAATAAALAQVDAMHHGDGWYADGPGACFGHYSAWGMQLLLAQWARISGAEAFPGGPAVLGERLGCFLGQYALFFGGRGAPVVHGRSLTYRYAAAAPFWLGTMLGQTPLAPASTRRLASAVMRYFVQAGALDEGLPSLGWHRSFPAMTESYSSVTSPLLSCLAFVGLTLPAGHPAWAETEGKLPTDEVVTRALPVPGFLCLATPDGAVRVSSHGATSAPVAGHVGYRKIAYSTHTSPVYGPSDDDGQVSLLTTDGHALVRRHFRLVAAADRFAASTWEPVPAGGEGYRALGRRVALGAAHRLRPPGPTALGPFPERDDRLEVASVGRPGVEIRVTHLWSLHGGVVRDGCYALAADHPPLVRLGRGWCMATSADGLTAAVISLYGGGRPDAQTSGDTSPFGASTVVPYVDVAAGAPETVVVNAHVLTAEPFDPDDFARSLRVEAVGRRGVKLVFGDGEEHLVQLFRPEPVALLVGRLAVEGRVRYARWSPDGTSFVL